MNMIMNGSFGAASYSHLWVSPAALFSLIVKCSLRSPMCTLHSVHGKLASDMQDRADM